MMRDYLLRELNAFDERRRRHLSAIQTKADIERLQTKVRRVLHACFGAFPERTPLNPQHTGEIVHDDYVIEKIIFESRPEFYVTANLYRPKSTAQRRPAVLHACGHYDDSKAWADYQLACIGLAKRGFVVLIFDPPAQGERMMYHRPGEPRPGIGEHPIAGKPMLLLGRTLANYLIWDGMRALDYLETRPDVDKARMGMLGHSGAGTMTLMTSPLEPRIRAAMSCCAVSSFYHKIKTLIVNDPEQMLPGASANGVDHPEIIATVAPRAFLIGAVLRDDLPLEGTRRTFDEARRMYEIMGVPDRFSKVESDNIHKLDKNLREACYGWMLRHLANESGDTREADTQVETPEALWCTKTGCVMDLKGSRSVFDLNRACSGELAAKRTAPPTREQVRALLFPQATLDDSGITVPTTLIKAGNSGALVVLIAEQGRNSGYAKEISSLIAGEGHAVLTADLRGWGETAPATPRSDKRYTWEEMLAWNFVQFGEPLLGMRVRDLLGIVRRNSREYRRIYVVGLEGAGLVAIQAAAIEPSIAGVAVNRTLDSYRDIMEQPTSKEPVSSFVWGALARYDMPELARLISPRPFVAVDAFNGMRILVSGAAPLTGEAATREILRGLRLA
jgi:cephalosporin-C deacetylase-like acetyl esterase